MDTDYLIEHLDELLDRINGRPTSPAFAERYNVTSALLLGHTPPPVRTVAAPLYVTDLGIRFAPDPAVFYSTHIKIAGMTPLNPVDIRDYLVASELTSLAERLDAVTLFFGDYASAFQAITARKADVIGSNDYRLLIYSGVIAGALGNHDALEYFATATMCTNSKTDRYAAQHRAATFEIKRQSSFEAGLRRLFHAEKAYVDSGTLEGQLDLAIMYNLVALAYSRLRDRDPESALRSADEHLVSFMRNASGDIELMSRAGRYRSQVAINAAQIKAFSSNNAEASKILKTNLETTRRQAFEYLPEAMGEYAYSLYLDGRYDAAARHASDAFWRYYQIGSTQGIRASREIVTACLYKRRLFDDAEHIAELCESDPIGIRGFDNIV
ncbi:hypothetical protein [Actinomyces ruminis]|uniref:hypothetical protein n=1 Tax=Actinomyces ruminis TaxID=1937003 RepID=UPI001178AC3C|nr:hypothetical protein [Actinomyces ruminis]